MFALPWSQQSCDAVDLCSSDPTVFASVTACVHLCEERQTNGKAGQVPLLCQECASHPHLPELLPPLYLRDECKDIQHSFRNVKVPTNFQAALFFYGLLYFMMRSRKKQ